MTVIDGIGKYTLFGIAFVYNKLTSEKPTKPASETYKEQLSNDTDSVQEALKQEPQLAVEQTEPTFGEPKEPTLNEIPEPLTGKDSEALLSQFFGSGTQDSESPKTADLQESQAAGMMNESVNADVVATKTSEQQPLAKSKPRPDLSLDDDMPMSIEDFENQPS